MAEFPPSSQGLVLHDTLLKNVRLEVKYCADNPIREASLTCALLLSDRQKDIWNQGDQSSSTCNCRQTASED